MPLPGVALVLGRRGLSYKKFKFLGHSRKEMEEISAVRRRANIQCGKFVSRSEYISRNNFDAFYIFPIKFSKSLACNFQT